MELTVPRRFCGPPESGNGGWVAGALAAHLPPDAAAWVSVRLSSPPPLGRPLTLDAGVGSEEGASQVRLLDGQTLVATAVLASAPGPDRPLPAPATTDQARAAESRYEGARDHPFPTCFVCGPARAPGDGLRLRPGPVPDGTGRFATTWTAPEEVDAPSTWSALDCPGGWAAGIAGRPMVLGTMLTRLHRVPAPGEELVVTAWPRGSRRRLFWSATQLTTRDGELLGRAEATWVAVDPSTVVPKEQR